MTQFGIRFFACILSILCVVLFDAGKWLAAVTSLYGYNYCCSWHDFICFHTFVHLVNAGRMFSTELLIFQRMSFFLPLAVPQKISNAFNYEGFNGKWSRKPENQRVIFHKHCKLFSIMSCLVIIIRIARRICR